MTIEDLWRSCLRRLAGCRRNISGNMAANTAAAKKKKRCCETSWQAKLATAAISKQRGRDGKGNSGGRTALHRISKAQPQHLYHSFNLASVASPGAGAVKRQRSGHSETSAASAGGRGLMGRASAVSVSAAKKTVFHLYESCEDACLASGGLQL